MTHQEAIAYLKPFIGSRQLNSMAALCRGEEGQFFKDKLVEMAGIIEKMPKTGETDEQGTDALVILHYFYGSGDWWITEKDMGCEGEEGNEQHQAFGYVNLGDDMNAEFGYVSLPELFSCNVELDLHWTPKPVKEVMVK